MFERHAIAIIGGALVLMALALMCTMAAAVFFQPALMGPPRSRPTAAQPAFEQQLDLVASGRPKVEVVDR